MLIQLYRYREWNYVYVNGHEAVCRGPVWKALLKMFVLFITREKNNENNQIHP